MLAPSQWIGLVLLILVFLLGFFPKVASADSRHVALVIGNNAYRGIVPLSSAGRDAEAIAERFKRFGFTLVGGQPHIDVGREDMRRLIDDFHSASRQADSAIFYFAGHGGGGRNNNFLLPVDSERVFYREDLPNYSVGLDEVLDGMADSTLKLVILDACRDFKMPSRSSGEPASLGFVEANLKPNTILAFAASIAQQAQEIGAHGIFTDALLDELDLEAQAPSQPLPAILNSAMRRVRNAAQLPQDPVQYVVALDPVVYSKPFGLPANAQSISTRGGSRRSAQPVPSVDSTPKLCLEPAPEYFRDCPDCPEMAALPGRAFPIGAGTQPQPGYSSPERLVEFSGLAVARHEISSREWASCVKAGGCSMSEGFGHSDLPVVNISQADIADYLGWIKMETGFSYRLPTEDEWEYLARGGRHRQAVHWEHLPGARSCDFANLTHQPDIGDPCRDTFIRRAPVGEFPANCYGLHDLIGNVWEWTQTCSHAASECDVHVARGGGWDSPDGERALTRRLLLRASARYDALGFRVVRDWSEQ